MTRHTLNWMTLFAVLALPSMAMAQPAKEQGGMWVDERGMTLYTFDKDEGSKSMCNGDCAKHWPPLLVKPGMVAEGDWTQIRRDDGAMQWAYDGKPLYTFMKDEKKGDMTGDGMKDVWHVAKP